MKEYKGFNIPESKEEIVTSGSNPMVPTIVISKDNGTRLNIPLSIEDANSLPFDKIDSAIKSIIDAFEIATS